MQATATPPTFSDFIHAHRDAWPLLLREAERHPLWPTGSSLLDDYEVFLRVHVEDPADLAVEELRSLWRSFAIANPEERHHQDLALAAWREYAGHLRRCDHDPASVCEVADELLENAIEESVFANLNALAEVSPTCDG